MQVQSAGKELIDGGNVLVAFYRERDSHAVFLLERQGITRLDLLRAISHGPIKVRDPSALKKGGPQADPAEDDEATTRKERASPQGEEDDGGLADDPLQAYAVDLIQRAKDGRIDPLVGRAAELERTIQVLMAHAHDEPIAPSKYRPDMPADLETIILKLLAKKAEDRFADVASLERALAACAAAPGWTREDAAHWWQSYASAATAPEPVPEPAGNEVSAKPAMAV